MTKPAAYSVPELAQLWSCSVDVIYDLLRSGKLQGFKLGKSWRISDEARRNYEQISVSLDRPKLRGAGKRIVKIT